MTIRTSGPLTLQDIANEFGGTHPLSLGNYYRGGSFVPSATPAGTGSFQTAPMTPNAGPIQIPTSGAIQLSHFYGVTNPGFVTFPADGQAIRCIQSNFPFGSTECYVEFLLNGTMDHGGSGGDTTNTYHGPSSWMSGATDGSDYEMICDSITGVIGAGPQGISIGVWTDFNIDLSVGASAGHASVGTCHCRIRHKVTNVVVATFTVYLECDNT